MSFRALAISKSLGIESLGVGTTLTLINHSERLLGGPWFGDLWWEVLATYTASLLLMAFWFPSMLKNEGATGMMMPKRRRR